MFSIVFRRRARIIRRRRIRRSRSNSRDYRARKEEARRFILGRLSFWQEEYGKLSPEFRELFQYKRLAIRNSKSRWGSCSSRKNLNFNYRILDLPQELQDYILVHELCHLKELNHGKEFWKLMELTIPHAKKHHKIVRKYNLN